MVKSVVEHVELWSSTWSCGQASQSITYFGEALEDEVLEIPGLGDPGLDGNDVLCALVHVAYDTAQLVHHDPRKHLLQGHACEAIDTQG